MTSHPLPDEPYHPGLEPRRTGVDLIRRIVMAFPSHASIVHLAQLGDIAFCEQHSSANWREMKILHEKTRSLTYRLLRRRFVMGAGTEARSRSRIDGGNDERRTRFLDSSRRVAWSPRSRICISGRERRRRRGWRVSSQRSARNCKSPAGRLFACARRGPLDNRPAAGQRSASESLDVVPLAGLLISLEKISSCGCEFYYTSFALNSQTS